MPGRGRLACLVALAVASSLQAQVRPDTARTDTAVADTPAAVVFHLPALEATGARGLLPLNALPVAASSLDRRAIRQGHATVGLDEALSVVPGVDVDNRYNPALGSRITMRGFGARSAFGVRGIRILVDGIPQTLPDGQTTLSNVDLGSAGRIQVLRGPSSLLYGNAAGGVIDIETQEPEAARLAEARVVAGDQGTRNPASLWKLQATVGGRGERSRYVAALSHMASGGFREHSEARRDGLNVKVRVAPDDASQLTFIANVADVPLAQNPGSLPADTALLRPRAAWPANVATGSGERSAQGQAGVRYVRRAGPGIVDVMLYGLGRSVDTALPFGRFIRLRRRGGGVRATYRAELSPGGRSMSVAAGVDGDIQRDGRRETDNVGGQPGNTLFRDQIDRVAAVGTFVLGRARALPALELTGGVRYDATTFAVIDRRPAPGPGDSGTRTLGAFSGSAGAVVHASPGFNVYGSVATSFLTPTTTELLNVPPTAGGPQPGGLNPDLRPQTAVSFEVGGRGRLSRRVAGQVAVYTMHVADALVPYQVASLPGRDFYRNAGRSRRRGVELGLHVQAGRGLTFAGAYTFSDFIVLDDGLPDRNDEGRRVPGVPVNRLTVTAAWNGAGGFVALEGRAFDRFFVDDANTATNPPASGRGGIATFEVRAGLRVRTRAGVLAPFLTLQNVTGARTNSSVVVNAAGGRYYEPAPGRALLFGASMTTR